LHEGKHNSITQTLLVMRLSVEIDISIQPAYAEQRDQMLSE